MGKCELAPCRDTLCWRIACELRAFAGAFDNGAPGLRPHVHAHYHGAFVIGPDGHDDEAVCHLPA